tara:strand:- start:110 stop:436 length:327 start_codon:yes stop_codon:yes gene_type:complete
MRLIAVLGVLFVLASCSNSDTEENFGLSCYEADELILWEFDFDKNIVIRNVGAIDYEYFITEVTPIKILFKESMDDYTWVLDRVNLTIELIYSPNITTTIFKCKLPKI